ncbi:MAG: CHASE2 domain-containing protein [bacterium]
MYSFVDVLNNKIPANEFKGKIVIVGYGGENFPVRFKTQFGEKIGTEIVADALNTLLIYSENYKK